MNAAATRRKPAPVDHRTDFVVRIDLSRDEVARVQALLDSERAKAPDEAAHLFTFEGQMMVLLWQAIRALPAQKVH